MNYELIEDKNVTTLAKHLENHGMLQQKEELEGLGTDCAQIEQLLSKLDELSRLLQTEKAARAQIEDRNEVLENRIQALEEGTLSYKAEQIFDATTARFMERAQALQQTYSNMKTFLRDSIADIVLDYKYSGRAALGKLSELTHIKGAMTRMKTLLENGRFEIQKALNRCQRIDAEYTTVVTALSNIQNIRQEEQEHINSAIPMNIRMGQKLNSFATKVWSGLDQLFANMNQNLERSTARVANFEADVAIAKEVRDILKTASRSEPFEPDMVLE